MSRRNTGDRVRVVIAGNIYTKRALVKRFLEDDGFGVVAEAKTRPELGAALDTTEPDAVVVDADLLMSGAAAIADIRRKAPGARIVVFTTGPEEEPKGADGYLEKGVGLAVLTALLGRLCSEPTTPLGPVSIVGEAAPPAATSPGPVNGRAEPTDTARTSHAALRAGAVAIAAVIVFALAFALFSSAGRPPKENPQTSTSGAPHLPNGPTSLQLAQSDLAQLRDALASGSYLAARVYAQTLMLHRGEAIDAGFSIAALDQRIGAFLSPLMASLAPRLIPFLQGVLGDLLPPMPASDGGGGPTTSGGGVSSGGSTSGGGSSGGSTSGGGTSGGGSSGGGGGGGDGFPGHGKHLGWAHKPPHGGWHGHKPK